MMRLAIDGREFVPGRVTGIQRFLRAILKEIADRRPHVQTFLLGYPGQLCPVQASHVRAETLPSGPTLYWDQALLPQALRRIGATLFFSPYYKAPMASPCPTVVTIHDLIPLDFPLYRSGRSRVFALLFRRWAGMTARRAAAIVTDSLFSKASLLRHLALQPDRVHVLGIPVGCEFRHHDPQVAWEVVHRRYGIATPYLLSVGNFLPHKNLPRLVEAYSMLPAPLRGQTTLVLAGVSASHGQVRPVDRSLLERPGIILPGFIIPEDLPLLYAGATALVCPSLVEGFGLPVLEAMACGTPVLCARAGALPEVAGSAAVYVDPLNTDSIRAGMERLLQDADLRAALSVRGLERAGLFDRAHTTVRLVDLLERVGRSDA